MKPPVHKCVWNHHGSSKSMESEAGLQAVQEMANQGTPVQIIEGDGDNTLIARAKNQVFLLQRSLIEIIVLKI